MCLFEGMLCSSRLIARGGYILGIRGCWSLRMELMRGLRGAGRGVMREW